MFLKGHHIFFRMLEVKNKKFLSWRREVFVLEMVIKHGLNIIIENTKFYSLGKNFCFISLRWVLESDNILSTSPTKPLSSLECNVFSCTKFLYCFCMHQSRCIQMHPGTVVPLKKSFFFTSWPSSCCSYLFTFQDRHKIFDRMTNKLSTWPTHVKSLWKDMTGLCSACFCMNAKRFKGSEASLNFITR